MAREDDEPPMKRRRLEPLLLDSLGIEELRSYIDELTSGDRPGRGGYRPQEQPSQRGGRILQAAMKAARA